MPTRHAAAVSHATLAALGIAPDPTAWAADVRRAAAAPAAPDELATQVAAFVGHAGVTLLPRDAASLGALLDEEAFPLLLVGRDGGRLDAIVLERRAGDEVLGARVDDAGQQHPFRAAAASLLAPAAESERLLFAAARTDAALTSRGADTHAAPTVVEAHHGEPPLARLWTLLVRERRDVWLVFGYATLAGLFSLALPLSIQQIVQLVSGRMLLQPTFLLVAFVVLGTVGVGVLQLTQLSVVESVQQRVFARAALDLSFRVPRLRFDVALRENLPELMNRFFETVTIQKSLAKLLLDLSTALLTVLFGLALLMLYHPYFTFFGAALALVLALLFWVTGPRGLATSLMESKYKYRIVHWLEEVARANTAFKFAGRSALPVERTDELLGGYLKYRRAHFRVLMQQGVALVGFRTLVVGALLVLGISLVTSNQITLGQFVASEIVIVTIIAGVEKLVVSLHVVYDLLTAVDKLGHVTDLPLEPGGGLAAPACATGMALTLTNVAHRYAPDAPLALAGVTLSVRAGERLGITGYEGSGQTTLLRLLGGLLDGYEGGAAVDGVPLRELERASYRGAVGQLLSPTDLFDGTVEENVAVGRPGVRPSDVLEALDAVGLTEWVQEQSAGLRTPITNGGRALPSHVLARLLVAQAVVGRPRLVLVDDYYQNVEPDCRQDIIRCLTDRARPWTLVLVSHDPAFLTACDRVVVLAEGRAAREGPFERLADESAFVRRLIDLRRPAPRA